MRNRIPIEVVQPTILNPNPKYSKVKLIAPTTLGYVYIAAAIKPGRLPFVLPSARRSDLLQRVKELAEQLTRAGNVVNATVFRAIVMPPTERFSSYLRARKNSIQIANFDLAVLIETTSPGTVREVQGTPPYRALLDTIRSEAERVHVVAARNAKRIADVDTTRPGLFLFNHFVADDARVMLELWEYLADWYSVETGLNNSVAMVPLEGERSDYTIINWARWDSRPLNHFWSQLSKKSFWKYVAANLEVNHAASMPIYCRLA
jgi:hypothetical protein